MSQILHSKIKSRGFWLIRVIPGTFVAQRIQTVPELKRLIRELAVDSGGVAFPSGSQANPNIGKDWIGLELDGGEYAQAWRFYQSAQLMLYEAFIDDWLDHSIFGTEPTWAAGRQLSVSDVLMTHWQAYEFATRLAATLEGRDPITVSIHAFGLRGRELLYRFPNRSRLRGRYTASINDYETTVTVEREKLMSGPVEYAVESAQDLFTRFGWDVGAEQLKTLLRESGLAN